ncbi:MAG: hypothetical protein OXC01_04505 [Immundisolibacterales bacterium]|nr:hypothetical protein [Immundisolibacterales bacterium]
MSRLDSAIRRLMAQRACLDLARDLLAGTPGHVFELGLGNGRTYDHLREQFPDRGIFVFERKISAHPSCIPDDAHLFLGDVLERLPAVTARFAGAVALVHADIGSGVTEDNRRLAARLSPLLAPLLAPGALVVSDQQMTLPAATPVALPEGVASGRYHMARTAG